MIWKLIPHFRKRKNATAYELLEAVIDAIQEEPRRVNMQNWVVDIDRPAGAVVPTKALTPACNTVGCIAGWMATMTAPTKVIVPTSSNRHIGTASKPAELVALALLPPDVQDEAQELFLGRGSHYDMTLPKLYPFPIEAQSTLKDQRRYANEVIKNIRLFMKRNKTALQGFIINPKEVYGIAKA